MALPTSNQTGTLDYISGALPHVETSAKTTVVVNTLDFVASALPLAGNEATSGEAPTGVPRHFLHYQRMRS